MKNSRSLEGLPLGFPLPLSRAVAFRATPFQPFNRSEQTVAHLFPCPVALRLELITHTTRWPCLKSRGCRVRESQI